MPDLAATPATQTLHVEVGRVRWSDPAGGFAILDVVTDEGDDVVLRGPLAHVGPDEALDVTGRWEDHPRHGRQLVVEHVRVRAPVSDAAVRTTLARTKHVGRRGAAWLVAKHGVGVMDLLDADPRAILGAVPGIGPARIDAAVRSWQANASERSLRTFLDEHGVPAAVAARVARHADVVSLELLRTDPYALCELDGVGFLTADALARALGTPPDAPGRLDAGLVHALELAEADGHCFLPRAELGARAEALLGADVLGRLEGLAARGLVVVEGDRVWEARLHATERGLARRVTELLVAKPALDAVEAERPTGDLAPSDAQWSVVEQVLGGRLALLTGGPGTGKTQAMRTLVDVLGAAGRKVRLCAPTGKAARRLAETTGASASTVHRLLEWVPGEGFAKGADDPIGSADLLVVDEASMLDVRLAAALFDAVGPRTHVLLVGDPDQLPPVGPGRVLEDLLAAGSVPTTRLTEVFRQAARSMIVRAAHAMNHGELPPVTPREGDLHDFFLIGRRDPAAIFREACDLVVERLPRHYGVAPSEVQLLAPMHRGPLGIDAFNEALRARLNPEGSPIGGTPLRVGDRVIQTRNDHEHELMNGELGVIATHDADRDDVVLATDDGRRIKLDVSDLGTLRLAHAVSIHKAQGSQMPVVVLPVHRSQAVMLSRPLVYTGVTRATTAVVLVGDPDALATAVRRTEARGRHTALAELVT